MKKTNNYITYQIIKNLLSRGTQSFCIFLSFSDYKVVFYPGGHGPMFDLPHNDEIASLTERAYQSGAIVSSVCHGAVGKMLINV